MENNNERHLSSNQDIENNLSIDRQKKLLKGALMKQRLDKVSTGSIIVDTSIQLAENLGGYIGGSRRFNLQKKSSDVDVFFTEKEAYDIFCKYLTYVGEQKTSSEEIYIEKYREVPDGYKKVKKEYFNVLDKTIIKTLKGKYILDNIDIDVSCVDELLTVEEEVSIYAEQILKKTYDNKELLNNQEQN